ncbi:MAG: hypothetical protein ACXWWA_12305 [Chitinophagaceae bacterium]
MVANNMRRRILYYPFLERNHPSLEYPFPYQRIYHKLLKKPFMDTIAGLEMLKANRRYVKLINEVQRQRA